MRIPAYLTLAAALSVFMPFACVAPSADSATTGAAVARTPDRPPRPGQVPTVEGDTARRLVAVVYLRRDETTGTMRAELHPLAFAQDGEFHDATWPSVEEGGEEHPTLAMLPATERRFAIYEEGREIGRMTVDSIALATYACLELPVGLGSHRLTAPVGVFDETDPRVDRYRGWVDGEAEEYSLRYFLALSQPLSQPEYAVDTLRATAAAGRLRIAISQLGSDTLQDLDVAYLGAEERGRGESRLEELRLFDLDRDGAPEGVGRVATEATLHFDYYEEDVTDEHRLTATVWMRDRGPSESPELMMLQADVQSPDSWGDGWELVEALDLTGDGQAEVVYEWSGYESNSFHIFKSVGGQLVEGFGGGGHGC